MKLLIIWLSLCLGQLVAYTPTAHSRTHPTDGPTGITFFTGSWKDVLAEAKRQNKPIYVDVYTTWCPPCKRMAIEAFPNSKIGAKFNVHFINYQLDAEKGEGIGIAKRYVVSSYPTALYIAPNGALIHRAVGYTGINGMLDQANKMLETPQLRPTVARGDKDYAAGRRDTAFLRKYLKTQQTLNRPTTEVLDAYLDVLSASERLTNETMVFVAESLQSSTTKAFDYLIKNRARIRTIDSDQKSLGTTVSDALTRALDNDFRRASATSDEVLLETVIANSERNIASANPFVIRQEAQKEEAANDYRLKFLAQTNNAVK
ncbi:thioredoxin family protein [Spirosoma jeollabukense]